MTIKNEEDIIMTPVKLIRRAKEAMQHAYTPYSNFKVGAALLTAEDLSGLSPSRLRLARNEIYARHGRRFSDPALQRYFDSLSWYNGTIEPSDFNDNVFNSYERANCILIIDYEREHGYR